MARSGTNVSTSIRVLIVEDSESDALLLVRQLEREGYEPAFERVDTPQALRAALESRPWDLILADYSLPSFSAPEALALVRELELDLSFIIVSGTIDEAMAVETLRAGAHDFIVKGNWARLGPAIARALHDAGQRRERRHVEAALAAQQRRFQALVEHGADATWLLNAQGQVGYASPAANRFLGDSGNERVGADLFGLVHPDDQPTVTAALDQIRSTAGQSITVQHRMRHQHGDWRWLEATFTNLLDEPAVAALVVNAQDITERRRGEDRWRLTDEILARIQTLVVLTDRDGAVTFVNEAARRILGYAPAELLGDQWWQAIYPDPAQAAEERERVVALARREAPVSTEPREVAMKTRGGEVRWLFGHVAQGPGETLIGIGHDITERKQAEQRIQTQLRRLDALHAVDAAITSSLDVQVTLSVLLQQVLDQLGADAADVLLFRPHTQSLEYVAGRGFRSGGLERTPQRLGEGHAGRAALERRTVHVPDLRQAAPQSRRTGLLASQEFVSYFGVPLVAKGQLQGMLEVFHRTSLNPDTPWLNFLEALASQAAIAIDNALLFDEVQRSNTQLALAYDATIEGWSRAMDLRDKETEGHTRRVTELTVHLAPTLGIADEELVHLRRGALLHDIGKMGVPDAILLKPGPLTDAEWAIMRRHPALAYEMLAPIAYLRPALAIPYSHHEKWDGTGYPRQLKGEVIPLAARIFAVADVWDALRSDRPYRPAWPDAKVRDHIRALSGTHFDPHVVDAFLRIDKLPE
jgi:PAS domain S-box-containing protein